MKFEFIKMHGCGNDYIYMDFMQKKTQFNEEEVAKKLSNRHFGIGGDGLVLILPSEKADAYMKMFNADGTQGKMCGNAIRCVAKHIYEKGYVKKNSLKIDTLSGVKTLKLNVENNVVLSVEVNMGKPNFKSSSMPLKTSEEEVVLKKIEVKGEGYEVTCVSMGNPHAVVFVDDVFKLNVNELGEEFEKNELFKEEVNVEFVKIKSSSEVEMRVYERGSKETLACGTGACAVVAAMVKNGYCKKGEEVLVRLLGGELAISCEEDGVFMKGPATKVFTGEVEI